MAPCHVLPRDANGVCTCMQAQAVELLCRCDDIPDDGIELRVLKGLLTAVTSNAVHVHGQALLLVRPRHVDSARGQGTHELGPTSACSTCLACLQILRSYDGTARMNTAML